MEDIHDDAVEDMTVLGVENFHSVEDDELDIVVGLLDDEVYETRGGC